MVSQTAARYPLTETESAGAIGIDPSATDGPGAAEGPG